MSPEERQREKDRILTPELLFVIDATGSMKPYIDSVKASLSQLMKLLLKDYITDDLYYGAVFYRDFCDKDNQFEVVDFERFKEYLLSPEGKKKPKMIERLENIECTGGGDTCEDVGGGLKLAYSGEINRCKGSKILSKDEKITSKSRFKFVCLVADSPAHSSKLSGGCDDDYPGDTTAEEVIRDMAKNNITFLALEFNERTTKMFDEFQEIYKSAKMERKFFRFDLKKEDITEIGKMALKIAENIKFSLTLNI